MKTFKVMKIGKKLTLLDTVEAESYVITEPNNKLTFYVNKDIEETTTSFWGDKTYTKTLPVRVATFVMMYEPFVVLEEKHV